MKDDPEMAEPSPSLSNASSSDQGPLRSLLDDLPPISLLSPNFNGSPTYAPVEKRLHICNIPFKWREFDLRKLFSPYGEMKEVDIVTNERGSKGYGFVTFLDSEAADRAIEGLSGKEVDGRTIQVSAATYRRRRSMDNPPRNPPTNVWSKGKEPYSADFASLLLQQKQLLAQQQLQQYLIAQQQSDLIASALGLPTSNLGGLLTGSLPYAPPAGLPGLAIDPFALQLQQLQSLPLLQQLQQQQQQQPAANRFAPQQKQHVYGQLPPVSPSFGPQSHATIEIGPQLYPPNEMSGSSLSLPKNGSSTFRDGTSQRFHPYRYE